MCGGVRGAVRAGEGGIRSLVACDDVSNLSLTRGRGGGTCAGRFAHSSTTVCVCRASVREYSLTRP